MSGSFFKYGAVFWSHLESWIDGAGGADAEAQVAVFILIFFATYLLVPRRYVLASGARHFRCGGIEACTEPPQAVFPRRS